MQSLSSSQTPWFDVTRTNQAAEFGCELQLAMYDKLVEWSGKTGGGVVRVLAVPVVIADTLITLAMGVSEVAEDVIKGLANILGSCVFDECDFLLGVQQLLLHTPYDIVTKCVVVLCQTPLNALGSVLLFTIAPSYFNGRIDQIGKKLLGINKEWAETARGELWQKEHAKRIDDTFNWFASLLKRFQCSLK